MASSPLDALLAHSFLGTRPAVTDSIPGSTSLVKSLPEYRRHLKGALRARIRLQPTALSMTQSPSADDCQRLFLKGFTP